MLADINIGFVVEYVLQMVLMKVLLIQIMSEELLSLIEKNV